MNLFAHLNKKTLLWGAVGLLVFAVILFYLFAGKTPEPVVSEIETSPLEGVLGRELLLTLERLKSTTLDAGIFSDPAFQSLRDFGVVIAPQPVGRRNPFAPFEGSAGVSGKSAGATGAGNVVLPPAKKSPSGQPATAPAAGPGTPVGDFVDFSF